jgi:uncharacterized membrane protein YuzA (DUF378 family)
VWPLDCPLSCAYLFDLLGSCWVLLYSDTWYFEVDPRSSGNNFRQSAGALILASVSVKNRWQLMGPAIRAIGRFPRLNRWVSGKQPIIDSAEDNLLTFRQEAPTSFWATLLLNFLWHVLAVLEVYVILRFMGARISFGGAFIVEGLTKVINLVGALNPGNFGTYEVGNMLIAKIFGVTGTAGLTLALCRRVRTFFWAGIGGMCMIVMKKTALAQPRSEDEPDNGAGLHGTGTRSATR